MPLDRVQLDPLRAADDLKTDGIVVGQKLRLPQATPLTAALAPEEASHEQVTSAPPAL